MFFCFILLYETQLRAVCQHIFTFSSWRVLGNWGRARGVLGEQDNPELRSVLEKIGAGFEFDQLGKSYAYARNWLNEARELDPDGAVGQMAVLVSLARGGSAASGERSGHFSHNGCRWRMVACQDSRCNHRTPSARHDWRRLL